VKTVNIRNYVTIAKKRELNKKRKIKELN